MSAGNENKDFHVASFCLTFPECFGVIGKTQIVPSARL